MRSTLTSSPLETAEVVREYGPFGEGGCVAGVSFDGEHVWAALPAQLIAIDPLSGEVRRTLPRACDAGTAFDGKHLWQIAESRIDKIDPATGQVVATIPAPGGGCSGLAWAEDTLWVGHYLERKIYVVDPATGEVRRTIASNRFVTGVTWVEGELWHGTWESEQSELRRLDPASGEVLRRLAMPTGSFITGLESDGADLLYAGGGDTGKLRAVRRPRP